jgi:membrane-bound lytic murein transglycosylase MltF
MENSVELKQLIRKNAHLFWYSKDSEKENLPLAVVLEFFLNYANKEQIKKLFEVVGIENAAAEFFKQINLMGNRSNYLPQFQNYFSLYFKKYAPQYSK